MLLLLRRTRVRHYFHAAFKRLKTGVMLHASFAFPVQTFSKAHACSATILKALQRFGIFALSSRAMA
jgi:hypothetical protein